MKFKINEARLVVQKSKRAQKYKNQKGVKNEHFNVSKKLA